MLPLRFLLSLVADGPKSYGYDFLHHTYLHHVTRIDHRHNFSPYNTLLYLSSSRPASASLLPASIRLESIAFLPQMLLSAVVLPLLLAKKDLPSTLLAQTFAFVTFNKVCTSQVRCSLPVLTSLSTQAIAAIVLRGGSNINSIFYGTWYSYHSTSRAPRYCGLQLLE